MAEILTCLEHDSIPIVPLRRSDKKEISVSHSSQIENLIANKLLPSGIVSWGRNSIKLSQFCGVLQLSNLTIEILPKIYGEDVSVGISSRDALIRMLKDCGYLKLHRSTQANIRHQPHTILDVFILAFCEELSVQIARGLISRYVEKEENLNVLRGKLLTGMQLKQNFVHQERMYCRYDELSEDTMINRIIKFTLQILSTMAHSVFTKKRVDELVVRFNAVSDVVISRQTTYPVLDRTSTRYKNILDQCKLFIQEYNPDVVAGRGRAFAFLFNMNQLFESWIVAKLRPIAREQGIALRSQGPIKNFGSWQEFGGEKEVFQMKPDISLLEVNDNVSSIADAKWKILNQDEYKMNISQSDLYQMQSYANRYNVSSLKLFYPKQNAFTEIKKMKILGSHNSALEIIPIDIANPNFYDFELSS